MYRLSLAPGLGDPMPLLSLHSIHITQNAASSSSSALKCTHTHTDTRVLYTVRGNGTHDDFDRHVEWRGKKKMIVERMEMERRQYTPPEQQRSRPGKGAMFEREWSITNDMAMEREK